MPTRGGSLVCAGELFDSHVAELADLVDGSRFPAEGFEAEEMQVLLLKLKMRNTLHRSDALECARSSTI